MKKVLIIGAGPGGFYLATHIATLGKNYEVTIVEKKDIGGTCLNIGCIPTKALLDNLSLFEHFNNSISKKNLFTPNEHNINLEGFRKHQEEIIKQLRQGIESTLKKHKITLIEGEASFVSGKKVLVKIKQGENKQIEADEIIIATGSKPKPVPSFEIDGEKVVTSDDLWNIPKVPKTLLIVGTGPIGVEFARVYKTLGSEVKMAEIKETICPILDGEISENLQRSLKKRGIKASANIASKQMETKNNLVRVGFLSAEDSKHNTEEDLEQVLIATGREPNIKSLSLDKAGIELDKQGFIKVDSYLQTNIENIWAIGDVTNFPQLAHTASFQAKVVAENIVSGKKQKQFDSRFIPACIYGYPEIAFVGKTEEELKDGKINYVKGTSLFLASGKAKASGLTEGLVKVLIEKDTKEILGAHIIGPEASNLIHEFVVAMQCGITAEKLYDVIHAHPTYAETVYEAIENGLKQLTKIEAVS